MTLDATNDMTVQQIYREYGRLGAVIEPGAILTTVVLAVLVRRRRPALGLTVVGAALLVLAFAAWITFVMPANAELSFWDATEAPPGWGRLRDQWEYAHAGRFVLQLTGFSALLGSVPVNTPDDPAVAS